VSASVYTNAHSRIKALGKSFRLSATIALLYIVSLADRDGLSPIYYYTYIHRFRSAAVPFRGYPIHSAFSTKSSTRALLCTYIVIYDIPTSLRCRRCRCYYYYTITAIVSKTILGFFAVRSDTLLYRILSSEPVIALKIK